MSGRNYIPILGLILRIEDNKIARDVTRIVNYLEIDTVEGLAKYPSSYLEGQGVSAETTTEIKRILKEEYGLLFSEEYKPPEKPAKGPAKVHSTGGPKKKQKPGGAPPTSPLDSRPLSD